LAFAAAGASVVVNDRGGGLGDVSLNQNPADDVVEEIRSAGGTAAANYEDVSDFEAAGRIVQTALDNFGRVDIMVTNAGTDRRGPVLDLTPEDWDLTLKVHVYGSIYCAVQAGRAMRSQGSGAIVTITSPSFPTGAERLAPYVVSKGAIYSLTRTLALELKPLGITVNALAPRRTLTRATEEMITNMREKNAPADEIAAMEESFQRPEDVAPLALFFATPESREVTGRILFIEKDRIAFMGQPAMEESSYHPTGHWSIEDLIRVVPRLDGQ
jgi:NAD(P)-dependent dehydrogenase (short-subunit alcohol dehydrogenase family)